MSKIDKIFKPRRGKKSTMYGTKKDIILLDGELFIEYPDTGVGTGHGKAKMGDGITSYDKLPYLFGDTSNEIIEFVANTSSTVDAALSKAISGTELKVIVASYKQCISLLNQEVIKMKKDIENIDVTEQMQPLTEKVDLLTKNVETLTTNLNELTTKFNNMYTQNGNQLTINN